MMNERIKELAKQAGGNPNHKAFRGHSLPPPPDHIDPATVDLEKFVELLIQECADVCLQQRDPSNLNYKPSEKFAEAIKQHFGVEK